MVVDLPLPVELCGLAPVQVVGLGAAQVIGQLGEFQERQPVGVPLAGLAAVRHHQAVVTRLIVPQHAPGVQFVDADVRGGHLREGPAVLVEEGGAEGPALPGSGG